jgi:pathogenesis-related protein 1
VAWLGTCVTCGCTGSIQALDTDDARNRDQARPVQTPAAVEPAELAGITDAHNRVRRSTGAPPLRWSAALAETARRWANACVDVEEPRGMIDHNPRRDASYQEPIGENIWATTAPRIDPVAAVDDWASEVAYFDRANNTCVGGACGHYTQLIWSATREVGCGVGSCPRLRFKTTLVCDYAPAGNIIGERPSP